MPLHRAQQLFGQPGRIKYVLVSNRGGDISGAALTNQVVRTLRPALAPLHLQANKTKADTLKLADATGSAFMSMFTTFGSFSIAAGILLIFLIFIMLASERRAELGIARAVGTRQRNLVQMFLFEGVAYDVLAAAVGALLGVVIAYLMVLAIAGAFDQTSGFHITYSVTSRTVIVSYALGVLLTFAVVTASAWRVSRMNIVTAIRNLPEPPSRKQPRNALAARARRGRARGAAHRLRHQRQERDHPRIRRLTARHGARARVRAAGSSQPSGAHVAGLALVAWFVLPMGRWLFGTLSVNFSIFILSGIMIVLGASWTLMYNADLLLAALSRTLGRIRALAPVLKMSMAYPLRNRFRTGVTLAMFTLVVFTLVTGATTTTSFVNGVNDLGTYGGGFDVRATIAPTRPISEHAGRPAAGAGHRRGRLPRRLGAVVHAGQGAPGRHRRALCGLRRARARLGVPHPHHLRPLRARVRVQVRRPGVARAERP